MIKFTLARLKAQDGLNVKAPWHNYAAFVSYLVSWSPNVLFSLEYGIRNHFEVIDVLAAFFFCTAASIRWGDSRYASNAARGSGFRSAPVSARTAMIGRCIGNRH
jgi:hypothetical protein